MFESLHGAKDVIKFVAAYDEKGESKDKIDTKLEYDILGRYLNGASAWTTDENGNEYKLNYADLSSKDKKDLFGLMNSLQSKFGNWKNYFSENSEIDNETIHLYLERYREFQIRLNNFEDDSKREEYYKDIKKELNQVENKIKNYCSKQGFSADLDIGAIDDLHKKIDNIKYEEQVTSFLKDADENFAITDKNAKKYAGMADYLFHNSLTPVLVSKEDYDKAANIMKKAYSEYLSKYNNSVNEDNIQSIDIIDGVNQISSFLQKQKEKINPQIIDAAKGFLLNFEDEYKKITPENASKYAGMFQFMVENFEILNLSEEEKIQYDKLKKAYSDFLNSWNNDITFDNIEEYNITLSTTVAVDYFERIDNMKDCGIKVKGAIVQPYDNKKLQKETQQYIKENNVPQLKDAPKGIDIGNGKFDKISTQKNNNCWIHSGITSLLSSEKGIKLVENNYYRDEKTGVIAVHIPEAEQFNLHGGIFYVLPEEIIDAQDTVASGEGDITAYIIAIQKYFDEVLSNPDLAETIGNERIFSKPKDGNSGCRFYELMTGGSYTTFREDDNDEIRIQPGIGRGRFFDSNKLYEMVEKQRGSVSIALEDAEHAISIIGVKDGKFIVQESNNDNTFFERFKNADGEDIFEKIISKDGKTVFALPKEALEMYNLGAIDYIMWE